MGKVYIVHCIDTEGPLYETLEATFERLRNIFEIEIEPTEENLRKLQEERISLGGKEKEVSKALDNSLLSTFRNFSDIEKCCKSLIVKHLGKNFWTAAERDGYAVGFVWSTWAFKEKTRV